MRDIVPVIQQVKEIVPDTWPQKHLLVASLNQITRAAWNTKPDDLGIVWLKFLAILSPIISLGGSEWAVKVAAAIAGDGQGNQALDWQSCKTHEELTGLLEPCPVCKHRTVEVGSSNFSRTKGYYVFCKVCRNRTDEFDTAVDVVKFWNSEEKFL